MLQIVVFDGGWGGELVADYLSEELTIAEVIRVIDWSRPAYTEEPIEAICARIEDAVGKYIGKAAVIVLGGYGVTAAITRLRMRHPEQLFVGMGINYDRILRTRNFPSQVALFADQVVLESGWREEVRQQLPYSTLIIPDCQGWADLIDNNIMTSEILRRDLEGDFALVPPRVVKTKAPKQSLGATLRPQTTRQALMTAIERFGLAASEAAREENAPSRALNRVENDGKLRPDVILLLNTHFWEIKRDLEVLFGCRTRVLDFREKLLRDICSALHLRGVDGKRSK